MFFVLLFIAAAQITILPLKVSLHTANKSKYLMSLLSGFKCNQQSILSPQLIMQKLSYCSNYEGLNKKFPSEKIAKTVYRKNCICFKYF